MYKMYRSEGGGRSKNCSLEQTHLNFFAHLFKFESLCICIYFSIYFYVSVIILVFKIFLIACLNLYLNTRHGCIYYLCI